MTVNIEEIARAIRPLLDQTDDAETIVRAAMRAAVQSEAWAKMWRPIATSPGGRTEVLLWDGHEISVGFLWEEDGGFYSSGDALIVPTHWMPLPDPPLAQAGEAQRAATTGAVEDEHAVAKRCAQTPPPIGGGRTT